MKVLNYVKRKCQELNKDFQVNFLTQVDKEKMQKAVNTGLPNYIEIQHAENLERIEHSYSVINKVKIKRSRGFTCPLKTFAIVAHNEEFSLLPDERPELI